MLGIQTARSRTALGICGFPISRGFTCVTQNVQADRKLQVVVYLRGLKFWPQRPEMICEQHSIENT